MEASIAAVFVVAKFWKRPGVLRLEDGYPDCGPSVPRAITRTRSSLDELPEQEAEQRGPVLDVT